MTKGSPVNLKKVIGVVLAIAITIGLTQPASAESPNKPIVTSFTMTPNSVDIANANTAVTFNLVVTNPSGISSQQVKVQLSDSGSNSLVTTIFRTDLPVQSALATVTFQGTVVIPSNLPTGVYVATADPIVGMNADGTSGYKSDAIKATTSSTVIGATNSLLVRSSGVLNFNYATFKGPSWKKTLGTVFVNPKYNSVADPIWKVGESLNASDFYEMIVPSLSLKVKSYNSNICTADGSILKFVAIGSCSFTVYTDGTSDYLAYKDDETFDISSARTKPTYVVGAIPTQSSAILPLIIPGPFVYGPLGLITPVSATASVCFGAGTSINIISGGTCTLNYSSAATSNYLASDIFPLTFEISRTSQTLSFTLPSAASLAAKSLPLSSTASSGLVVGFMTNTPATCSVTGNSLNLLKAGTCQVTASQNGTTTIAPVSALQSIAITGTPVVAKAGKKLVCIKNGKTRTVTSKTCPSGYKVKK